MRIPKLSKASDSEHQKSEADNFSCLFCSHPVKNTSLSKYENHLVQRHNLEKHVQQTILDTFNGQKRNIEKKNDELFSMKSVRDVMESMEKINKEKIKGTFKKINKDKGLENPLNDLLAFVEKSEKDFNISENASKNMEHLEQVIIKSEEIVTERVEVPEVSLSLPDSDKYKCDECDKSYDRAAKLNFHTKKAHTNCHKTTSEERDASPKKPTMENQTDNVNTSGENKVDQEDNIDWTDYLIFDCKVCQTKMPSSMYPDHLLTWHSLSLSDYQQKTGDSGSCTPAEYQCLVCIAKIPWEKLSLLQHLGTHKLTVGQYQVIFAKAIEKQVVKQTEMVKKGKAESLPEKVDPTSNEAAENILERNVTKLVAEKKMECVVCQKEFSTNFKLQRHVKADHCDTSKATAVKSLKTEPTSPVTKDKFTCEICRDEFPGTDAKIKDHLSQKHCLTKEFYSTLYGSNSGKKSDEKSKDDSSLDDKFSCKECIFSSSRKSALTGHIQKYHELTDEISCCKRKFNTKWAIFVHLMESHKDNKEIFAKFQVWPGLEKYYKSK